MIGLFWCIGDIGSHWDDSIVELLEHFDIDVDYDFDRTHEEMEDVYWAASQQNGFQFRFDETQKLDVVFSTW